MVGIVSYGVYIPKYRIKIGEIARQWGKDPEIVKHSLKISEKSVPSIDEDTATIAVEAARAACKDIDTAKIGSIYIGSESHPYAVKPTGTIVGQALAMHNSYMCADFEFACKAGTAAIQVAMTQVQSGMIEYGLAGGVDTAQAAPQDMLEYSAAAGGAMFIIGHDPIAKINHTLSYTSDTHDFWRRSNQRYPSHGGAFTGEPAYFKHVTEATKNLMKKAGTKPLDYNHVVFHQPNGKFPMRVSKRLGFTHDQMKAGLLVGLIGNTYSAASLLGLAAVLDIAQPGERILLTSYGSGAGSDSFDMIVTDKIKEHPGSGIMKHINDKAYMDYSIYLKHTSQI